MSAVRVTLPLSGAYDQARLRRALATAAKEIPALRTEFFRKDGEWRLRRRAELGPEAFRLLDGDGECEIDVGQAPLVRVDARNRDRVELLLHPLLVAEVDAEREIAPAVCRAYARSAVPGPRGTGGQFPLSAAQERIWLLDQLTLGKTPYTVPLVSRLRGPIDVSRLKAALTGVATRHEVLRARFRAAADGRPVQEAHAEAIVPFELVEVCDLPADRREAAAREHVAAAVTEPFDVARQPPLRARLVELGPEDHVLTVVLHHLVADAWSLRILHAELAAFYADGEAPDLPPLPTQVFDHVAGRREEDLGEARAHWRHALAGAQPLSLPADWLRPRHPTLTGAGHPFECAPETLGAVDDLALRCRATRFMVLAAAFAVTVGRFAGQEDLVFGTPLGARARPELEPLIGCFVEAMPLRVELGRAGTFAEAVEVVRAFAAGAYEHREVPQEVLVAALRGEGEGLFPVWLSVHDEGSGRRALEGTVAERFDYEPGVEKFDLALTLFAEDGLLRARLRYRSELFAPTTIARIAECFKALLESGARHPDRPLAGVGGDPSAATVRAMSEERPSRPGKGPRQSRRRALSTSEFATTIPAADGDPFATIVAARPDVDLAQWVIDNREYVTATCREAGAVLLRGFAATSIDDFDSVLRGSGEALIDYTYRSTPRTEQRKSIYTSTEYPPPETIPMHSELSYSRRWPLRLWFFCAEPARAGGATPLADNRKVLARLSPALRDRFERLGVMYVRTYGGGVDLDWPQVFGTDDRAELEAYCREADIEVRWDGDRLQTRQVCQGTARHPGSGETVWFNQAHLFHPSALSADVSSALVDAVGEDGLPRTAFYGDGSEISPEDLDEVRSAFAAASVDIEWQAGDLLVVDNMLTAHGRRPFTPPRRILVAMAEQISGDDALGG